MYTIVHIVLALIWYNVGLIGLEEPVHTLGHFMVAGAAFIAGIQIVVLINDIVDSNDDRIRYL